MLDDRGFDLWADGYDASVNVSDGDHSYPFAGYKEVLGRIYAAVRAGGGKKVLDVGFGTGVLAGRLYRDGYEITGVDFSERMVQIAGEKMPWALLMELRSHLSSGGAVYVGDVAFENRRELELCRQQSDEEWDEEEIYPVAEEIRGLIPEAVFEKVSHCAGIFTLRAE